MAERCTQETPFNFDLEEMKIALNSGYVRVPHFKTFEEFDAWVMEEQKR